MTKLVLGAAVGPLLILLSRNCGGQAVEANRVIEVSLSSETARDDPWSDLYMLQTGHGGGRGAPCGEHAADAAATRAKGTGRLDIVTTERTELPGGLVREKLRLPGFDPDEAVPGIAVHPAAGGPWPLVFVFHWFQGSKESLEAWSRDLAARGMYALAIDAHLHGERSVAGIFQRENMPDLGVEYSIWVHQASIARTAKDVSVILDAFGRRPEVDTTRVAATGMSMGAGTAMVLAWREPRIRIAASLVGAVDFWWDVTKIAPGPGQDAKRASYGARLRELVDSIDPLPRAKDLPPKAIFLANGGRDGFIAIESVRRFVRELEPLYGEGRDRLRFVEVPDAGHEVTGAMWKEAQDWIVRHVEAGEANE